MNGDGVVDVADIAAIIKIMKDGGGTGGKYTWYLGVIAENDMYKQSTFDNLAYNQIGNKPTTMTTPASIPNGSYLVMMYPSSWGNPIITLNSYGTGDGNIADWGVSNPTGKVIKYWDGAAKSTTFDITWE